ncbi:hypothetical protein LXA43DRAFT_1100718 [Ganoderma leucocontextum]|nr:hypothetical protein LXA43DRAFT_1100718 [Ganoderma leucocontextum]
MLNHTEPEKACIRGLTKHYLPTNLAQKDARRDCPHGTLHHHQASYGQNHFENISIIFEICRADPPCKFSTTPLPLQMSAEKRVDLLSELETLDPPPYHDPANIVNRNTPITAKAIGHLTRRKQVNFRFWQGAVAEAFGFDLNSSARPKFELYLTLGDEWTDKIHPMALVRGRPVLVRREGVRNMPAIEDLKKLLNLPFDPNGLPLWPRAHHR